MDLLHVLWLFIASDAEVDESEEAPYDKGDREDIVAVKCLIKSHILELYTHHEVYLSITGVGRKGAYAQLDHSYRGYQH